MAADSVRVRSPFATLIICRLTFSCLFLFKVWLTIATVLQNFDIQKKVGSDGKEFPISMEYSEGLIR